METGFAAVDDLAGLAARWHRLEARVPQEGGGGGFFRSWCFLSPQFAARFGAPLLFYAREGGEDLALALLNRAGRRLYLHQSGDAAWDSFYIEHNGLLMAPAAQQKLPALMADLAARGPVVMAGVDDAHLAAAQAAGRVTGLASQFAPALELDGFAGAYLDQLSANTRGQIRRALKRLGGAPAVAEPTTLAEALDWFEAMVALHQASWQARGKPGAFGPPALLDWHRQLLAEAWPAGAVRLLRVAAGAQVLGYLHYFVSGGTVHAYQSGFAAAADARDKPGLVCHASAIEHLRAQGVRRYDFMAGAARYKLNLAPRGGQSLHWFTLYPSGSWQGKAVKLAELGVGGLKAALARRKRQA